MIHVAGLRIRIWGFFYQIRIYPTGSGFVHNAQIQNFFIIQLLFNYLSTKVTRKFNLLNKLIFFQLFFINKSFDILNILNFFNFFFVPDVFFWVGSGIRIPDPTGSSSSQKAQIQYFFFCICFIVNT